MRYRLRTLLIVSAVAPPVLAGCWYVGGYFGCSSQEPGFADRVFPSKRYYDLYRPMVTLEEIVTGRDLVAGWLSDEADKNDPGPPNRPVQ
jgi:hypothetical protein